MARKSSSRSPSPSRKKAAPPPSGPVSAQTALTATLGWFALISASGLILPDKLMEGYQIPLDKLRKDEKAEALVIQMFQNWVLWLLLGTGIQSIVRRNGNKTSEGLCCLANLAMMLIFLGVGEWKANAGWIGLGMPEMSINFNRALFSVFVVMNYLGWQASGSPKPDLALLKGNTSLASKYTAALCVVFGAAMLLDLDGLFEQYHFTNKKGTVEGKWIEAIFTGMGQTLIGNTIALVCMLGADKKTAGEINRWIWAFFGMQIAAGAILSPLNKKLLMTEIDPNMQLFNIGLWFAGGFLAWKEMIV